MPSPAKRPQRASARRETRRDSTVDRPDESSPSRPSKRRKKVDESPQSVAEEEGSSLIADHSGINMNDNDLLIARVTQQLIAPKDHQVQASKDHANAIHEANKAGVQAYAKIAAPDWTFYVTKLSINIGRSSEPTAQQPQPSDPDDEDFVHIDLGPSKMISRQHILIYFNSKEEKWFLFVKGRNGIKVDGAPLKQGFAHPLTSGEVIEVGGNEMMFVLPSEISPLHIQQNYLERAGISSKDLPDTAQEDGEGSGGPSKAGGRPSSAASRVALPRGQPGPQPIAPAPPDYKRPGTPPSAAKRALSSQKTPRFRDVGPMLMNGNEVDLSLDENKHIKPQYSYAQMISQAIMNTTDGKLNLNGIYNFITNNYSYYKHQQAGGWQNSIRHNLSLNKAFEKVARSTDEPGKGMKWQIVAEVKDEMMRSAYKGGRGGHRGSSNPSSPNQLNYITQGPKDMAARDPGSARKRKVSPSGSPQPRSPLRDSIFTPDRPSRRLLEDSTVAGDGSPLPRFRKVNGANAAALTDSAPRSPTLTSSYLPDDGTSFVTPAPHRVHPRLAPPSTAQRPSQHMPTSSPAPFWKYAEIGSTPLKPASFDLSPSRPLDSAVPPPSSSPAPAASKTPQAGSPLKKTALEVSREREMTEEEQPPEEPAEEEGGFDLTRGFQSIGSYHAPVRHGVQVASAMNGASTPHDRA